MRRCQSLFAIRYSLFAILFCALSLAEPTVWPVPFEARAMFPAVLDLARASACKDIAALIDREDHAAALALTEKTMAGPFLWRGALTNGYQQGFCLYALHGLLLEQHGEVVRAYRTYQNSRACFDDDTVMMAQPEPRLEVFAGIGRMCYRIGRLMDADVYLHAACALSNAPVHANQEIALALAKVRASGGQYEEALQIFGTLETRGVEFDRNTWCCYAAMAFQTGRAREGVRVVLSGLSQCGVDPQLCENDPLMGCVRTYWHHFEDADILDLDSILSSEVFRHAMKGRENVLAFLINTRRLLCRVCPELLVFAEDDLALLSDYIRTRRTPTESAFRHLPLENVPTESGARSHVVSNHPMDRSTNAVEDEINAALFAAQLGRDTCDMWARIEKRYGDTALCGADIDGVDAHFICHVALARAYLARASVQVSPYPHELMQLPQHIREAHLRRAIVRTDTTVVTRALHHVAQALDRMNTMGNLRRIAAADLLAGELLMLAVPDDHAAALAHIERARSLAGDDTRLKMASWALHDRVEPLQGAVLLPLAAQHTTAVPRRLRERAAVELFSEGLHDAACEAALNAITYSDFDITAQAAIEVLELQQDYLSYTQLCRLRKLLLQQEFRIAAVLSNAPVFALWREISDKPWLAVQEQLAAIEQGAAFTDADMACLRAYATPSRAAGRGVYERAAKLCMLAQTRGTNGAHAYDWRAWVTWVQTCAGQRGIVISLGIPAPRANRVRSMREAVAFYYTHQVRIPDTQRDVVSHALCDVPRVLPGRETLQLTEYECTHGRTNAALRIALAQLKTDSPDPALGDFICGHLAGTSREFRLDVAATLRELAQYGSESTRWKNMLEHIHSIVKEGGE